MIQKKDKKGQIQNFEYDYLNRLTEFDAGSINMEYLYDRDGKILNVKDSNGSNEYQYYDNSKLKKHIYPDRKYIEYTYDANGNIKTMRDPFGEVVEYTYDSRNRLKDIEINNKIFTYEYYDDGMIKSLVYPSLKNGEKLKTSFLYDKANRLVDIENKKGSTVISKYSYKYDLNGNIIDINEGNKKIDYSYDSLNRINQIDKSNNEQVVYGYDVRGNINSIKSKNYTVENPVPGNYSWNELNMLTGYTNEDGKKYEYMYDYNGLRINKKTPNETINYYYDSADRIIGEVEKNSKTVQIVWGNKPLARIINGEYYYYLYNGHGDVVQVVDENGTVVNSYEYDEWGNIINQNETIENPIKYSGEYYDKESGNYYLKARYYNPASKRFIR